MNRLLSIYPEGKAQQSPGKWCKYLLLSYFDLVPERTIRESIRRYGFGQLEVCREDLVERIGTARRGPRQGIVATIKLIPLRQAGQLPNYLVHTAEEIEQAFEEIRRRSCENWVEIWFCENVSATETFTVGGRFLPSIEEPGVIEVLEQVWHTSPRRIEELGRGTPFPYLRAERRPWLRSLDIKRISLPDGYPIEEKRLLSEYRAVVRFILERREAWELFVSYLAEKGVRTVSLEYKVNDSEFSFIDWDTDADDRVI